MSWLDSLFGRDSVAGDVAQNLDEGSPAFSAPIPAMSFSERVTSELDSLARVEQRMSSQVSAAVFSQLRTIDDIVRPLLVHISTRTVLVETEVALESLVKDYVPTPLSLFEQLPANEKVDGGKADLLLQSQYATIISSTFNLAKGVYGNSMSALETNAIFVQDKFNGS